MLGFRASPALVASSMLSHTSARDSNDREISSRYAISDEVADYTLSSSSISDEHGLLLSPIGAQTMPTASSYRLGLAGQATSSSLEHIASSCGEQEFFGPHRHLSQSDVDESMMNHPGSSDAMS